jgi:peptidoglycan/LPS O-acetylase OafA/YrhL
MEVSRMTNETGAASYLSIKNMTAMKGIAVLLVFVHHAYLTSGVLRDSVFRVIPQSFGFLAVSVFFFVMGYGLAYKTITYQSAGSMIRRVISQIIPIILLCLIYGVFRPLIGEKVSFLFVIKSFFINTWLIEYGWYFYVALYFNVLISFFYLVFKRKQTLVVIICSGLILVFYFIELIVNRSSIEYECLLNIVLGMMWFRYSKTITQRITAHRIIALLVGIASFIICLLISYLCNIAIVATFFRSLSAIAFVYIFLISTIWVNITNKVSLWLGNHSLEIYGLQGLVFMTLVYFQVEKNIIVYFSLAIVATVLLSVLMCPARVKLQNLIRKE